MAERQSPGVPARREAGLARRGAGPFGTMQRLMNEMDRMFEDFGFGSRWRPSSFMSEAGAGLWAPDVDVIQRDNELLIRADLPGLTREDVSIECTDDALIIQGERRREHEEEREGLFRSERSYGSFYRTVPLPDGAITEQAKATFRDGVLEIRMPAPPASKGRRIEIEEGRARS